MVRFFLMIFFTVTASPHPTIPHLSLPTKFTCSKQSLTILEAGVLGRCSTRERTWAVPEAAGVPWEEGRLKKETANKVELHQPGQSQLRYLCKTRQCDTLSVYSCSPYGCQTSLTSAALRGCAQERSFLSSLFCFFCSRVSFHPGSPSVR